MLDQETSQAIREAFKQGRLEVGAVDIKTATPCRAKIGAVLRHGTGQKPLIRIALKDGATVACTPDHSLFEQAGFDIVPVLGSDLRPGDAILTVLPDGRLNEAPIMTCLALPPDEYTYDLSVPGPENFVLSNGILAHNSYSIGGVSLDIEKASKYESLKQNSEAMFDKATESKQRTVKFIRGLQQPRFGMGVRSSFGPFVGRGLLSPRNFI